MKFFSELLVIGAFGKRNIQRVLVGLIVELQVSNLHVNSSRGRSKLP